ncbi:hypothetical protein [Methanothermobacter wolfeii]|uniref:Uncharacterized protein n=1 Tax=Methanothermobacter wolfeii TaxID=145261 RepID=A0A9E7UM94_METWO|nr:hypothetical protein [Methanothermobacter wolfeii]MDI6702422.1 hypothetical protein [Methanothermobacter wolfeii]UXH32225.1 hypothetical protein N5910_02750 [Methanothermobacter wolfeii]
MINHFETASIGTPFLQGAEKGQGISVQYLLSHQFRPSSCLNSNSAALALSHQCNYSNGIAMTFILSLFLEGMGTEAVKK